MKVLVVGGGGREHAIVWKLSQSPRISDLYCAPGNGGIGGIARCIDIEATDIESMVQFARDQSIDLVVVTPDDPLALGMVDAMAEAGIKAFGPNKNAAIIESSKVFAKDLMKKYDIPTGEYRVFSCYNEALDYIRESEFPLVVKADGLALGKGVIIAEHFDEARDAIREIMIEKVFGGAGNQVVIEEFLMGQEVSLLAFSDGHTTVPMVSSQDHKRAFDKDEGPNTGGMGAFSPSRVYTPEIAHIVETTMLQPTIDAMNEEGRPFKGVLFLGLILTEDGPKLLEYNARFGDPETQVVLPRLRTDLLDILLAVVDERLDEIDIEWEDNAAACVVMASGGYPGSYDKGYPIHGLQNLDDREGVMVFHAGTRGDRDQYFTHGGRVLGITSVAGDLDKAIQKAYKSVDLIKFKDMHYRRDIGIK
ncbi:MAG TPA: phosphoribosylamine--glycine ligase [Clostridia bacterium]|nr:phosphoribosylamine--glycine ligase [Clostridia bacterium]